MKGALYVRVVPLLCPRIAGTFLFSSFFLAKRAIIIIYSSRTTNFEVGKKYWKKLCEYDQRVLMCTKVSLHDPVKKILFRPANSHAGKPIFLPNYEWGTVG